MICERTPQSRCRAAVVRADITPPVGIYHRMWGAARHDRATGVHRPLTATLLWLEPVGADCSQALLIAALDHCILDNEDIQLMRQAVADRVAVAPAQVVITLSHTHAAGLMSRSRSELPGGELIGPYLDNLSETLSRLAAEAAAKVEDATILYGTGRCSLARHRDFFDAERQAFVCGFHPEGPADDTLLTGMIRSADQKPLATFVNYACHPTTLAWDNTLISPDYPGALRETIEQSTGVPCVFLQGASGDLGPREGFCGDVRVADRNGRQVAHAALSALEALPPAGMEYRYQGPVISGAVIGEWKHQPLDDETRRTQSTWRSEEWSSLLPYRIDLPTIAGTEEELAQWVRSEAEALSDGDALRARDCRAKAEQMTRQLWRLRALPSGPAFPLNVVLYRMGDADWLFVPGEHYQSLQVELRRRFPDRTLVITTLSGGWQPGYVPPAAAYGYGIYQEEIAVVGAGSAELLLEDITRRLRTAFVSE